MRLDGGGVGDGGDHREKDHLLIWAGYGKVKPALSITNLLLNITKDQILNDE